jgi:hypothetical protein
VVAQRVGYRHAVLVGGDAGPQRGRVHHPGDEDKDERGHDRQVIAALYGDVDEVAKGEQHPHPPDHGRQRRPERLPFSHTATLVNRRGQLRTAIVSFCR